MAANKKFKKCLKYLGGIIFHILEYSIRHEVVFCFFYKKIQTTFHHTSMRLSYSAKTKRDGRTERQMDNISRAFGEAGDKKEDNVMSN